MPDIPPVSDPLWDALVTGRITHKFALFAVNMAVARAVRLSAEQPARKSPLIEELHQFCCRFADQVAPELHTLR